MKNYKDVLMLLLEFSVVCLGSFLLVEAGYFFLNMASTVLNILGFLLEVTIITTFIFYAIGFAKRIYKLIHPLFIPFIFVYKLATKYFNNKKQKQ